MKQLSCHELVWDKDQSEYPAGIKPMTSQTPGRFYSCSGLKFLFVDYLKYKTVDQKWPDPKTFLEFILTGNQWCILQSILITKKE